MTNTTSARPIISAAAVTAVRPGLAHRVLARQPAGEPAHRLERPPGQRGQRAHQARAEDRHGRAAPAPRPAPIRPAAEPEDSMPPNRPTSTSPTPPTTPSDRDARATTRPRRVDSGSAASRSAAIGDTRVARSAGTSADDQRHAQPDHQRHDDRAGREHRAGVRQVDPGRLEQRVDGRRERDAAQQAEQRPHQRRSATPRSPTEVRICRRDAPSVRSIPNSRIRWATVIENVLKIGKAPTKSDDQGEDQQRDLQEAEVVGDAASTRARRSPRRSPPAPSAASPAATRRFSSSVGALGGRDRDLVELAHLARHPLGLRQRSASPCWRRRTSVSPSFAMPTIR